jgi:D-alanine-D-alanine ligase
VRNEAELDAAVEKAAREDDKIIVEEAIVGQEVECAVLGNNDPEASLVGEIAASAEFYDYDDKYNSGKSQLYIPAHLSEDVTEEIRAIAVRAYRMLGCTGLSRVDFFVRNDKEVILNELNTMPGFTAISMYPKLWNACGVSYSDLLDKLVTLSFEIKSQY